MEKQIAVIGGDLRIAILAELLAKDDWKVLSYGFEKYSFQETSIQKIETLEKIGEQTECFFSSVPFSKDGIRIKAPFASKEIYFEEVFQKIKRGTFFAGALKEDWIKKYQAKITFVDLMEEECLTIQNAVSTVEGTIQKIMEETDRTIYQSKILILGFGRIGKLLANRLHSFGAQIYCEARKQTDLTWIQAYGYHPIPLAELKNCNLTQFDIVINTIPHLVLGEEEIQQLNPNCFVIDLASAPGGVDREAIQKRKIHFQWALALPGEVAPVSSAEFLKQAFDQVRMK